MLSMERYESLADTNQFSFICPLFAAKTRMGACVKLRDLVYAGRAPQVRTGCQAAMRCGKCPAAVMVAQICSSQNPLGDHHGSVEPKDGKLMAQILDRIHPVHMQEKVLNEMGVSTQERMLLADADKRIAEQLKTAPGETSRRPSEYEKPKRKRAAAPKPAETPVVSSTVNQAAMTGNLAAAINA